MELWMILFVINKAIALTCPFTSSVGQILGYINVVARFVFIALLFFFSANWWYGIIALAIDFVIMPLIIPKFDPNGCGNGMVIYSQIFSHLAPVISVFMYLSLFNVI